MYVGVDGVVYSSAGKALYAFTNNFLPPLFVNLTFSLIH